jgi:hypothetical protein
MKTPRRNSRITEDRHNVADQPGSVIFWSGVIISIVIGLILRGLMNPAKIQKMVEDAAARIHPEVKVTFESAHLSLARGVIPRLAVVIDKVRMESPNPCWFGPRLYLNEIRLPISVSAWLLGQSPIQRLEAGEVEARITAVRPAGCNLEGVQTEAAKTQNEITAAAQSEAAEVPSAVVLVRNEKDKRAKGRTSEDLESLRIDRLTLISEIEPVGVLELDNVEFLVRSNNPRVFHLGARLHLLKDESTGEYQTHANLTAEYKEFPERALDLRFAGNWREGSYTLTGFYQPELDQVKLSADLRHLPLSQVVDLLKRANAVDTDFQPRQSWLSFRADMAGSATRLKEQSLRLSDLQIEGDLGDIRGAKVEIVKMNPLRFLPFRLEIRSLDLDGLLQFLNRPHPSPMLSRLGRFRGIAEITDPMNFSLLGEYEDLEFIFSNKGQRELQNIKRIQGELRRRQGLWSIDGSRVEVNEGALDGDVKVTANEDFRNMALVLRIDDLRLSPAVQRLMTRGGHLSPAQSQLQMKWQEGQIKQVKGFFKMPSLKVEGVGIERLHLQLGEKNGEILIQPKIERIEIATDSAAGEIMKTSLRPEWQKNGLIVFNSVSGQFSLRKLREMNWTKLSARGGVPGLQFRSEGGWDEQGILHGQFIVRAKELRESWQIMGTRDRPTLRQVSP